MEITNSINISDRLNKTRYTYDYKQRGSGGKCYQKDQ